MARCTLAGMKAQVRNLMETQYQGHTMEDLKEAAESGIPVSFSVYPLEWTEAASLQYELYLPRVKADSVDGFVSKVARAIFDRYVADGGIDLSPEDIYCIDIAS